MWIIEALKYVHLVLLLQNSLQNVCSNGYKKYLRSRPGASVESVKRAKDINMNNLGIHYFFRAHCNENGGAAELLAKMKKYKPKGVRIL